MYKPVDPKVNFPELEESILHFWQEQHIFEKSITNREACEEFVFYDGPPFATGLPHFGHFVPSTIKDIIPRYQAMCGKKVERRFGWDCHGLPVENLIEKELGLNSKTDIERYGVTAFNEACRASVLRYVSEWRHVITRLGRWVDFDHDYKTMDPDYMETIWWVIKKLWDSGLLYEGHYILPYCPRCATVLSNHELNLGGYKDVYDPALTIRFKVKGGSLPLATNPVITTGFSATPSAGDTPATPPENTYLLAWTTTPWTLPSNLALAVGPDIDYVMVQDGPDRYILAEARLPAYYKNPADYTIVWRKKGTDLVGMEYEPLFPYFADAPASFRVYPGDFVSTEDGTGIVHTAPGFGEDDQRVLKGTGVPVICPVDAECRFTAEVPDYQGMFVKDADKAIMDRLKAEGKVIRRDQILHAYPHCWRCGHPLIYRAVGSWFVDVQKIKPDMLAANGTITWVPDHIKAGRFGKWLEGARDWAISRNRYWGNPLPIWKCPDCGTMICIGSRQELKEKSGVEAHDLHKHFVDEITIPCECGAAMHRVPEVLDCWFESGAMPYAQNHYPFENKEFFDTHFPADFINEGLDQTRGWFYTLTILAAALFKKPAFQHCIVSGLVLASDGKKMSKSLRNYTDPMEVVNRFGADALRLFLIHSSVVKADDLRYSDEGVRDVLKSIIIPLWNAYSFFVTYANIDKVSPAGAPETPVNPLDQWILSAAETLVERVRSALDSYDLSRAIDPILDYIDFLNNWYIRRSRRRFWRSENDADKVEAYHSLYTALKTLITVAAPFMPFTTDAIWQNLRLDTDPESVHLADFPEVHESRRNPELEYRMEAVQHAVSMGRALRSHYNLKVRQPLQRVELVTRNPEEKAALAGMDDIIREELNVKEVWFRENEEDLVSYEVKANFRVLGKELGKDMKTAAEKIADLSPEQIRQILAGKSVALEVAGSSIELTTEKIDIRRIEKSGFRVLNEGTLTVALDTEITPELAAEGDIRDLIRGLQNLRKESGFAVSDRIHLKVFGSPRLEEAWNRFAGFAAAEVLAVDYVWNPVTESAAVIEAGEETWRVEIERV
ncbi:isoleucine--tRNA ligase [Spirochaetia bacterium]|nr:isoleucine--tRNA ligase [Spirochaetia bacterium]